MLRKLMNLDQNIVFPVHPRTQNSLQSLNLYKRLEDNHNMTLAEPIGFLASLKLTKDATVVITDLG